MTQMLPRKSCFLYSELLQFLRPPFLRTATMLRKREYGLSDFSDADYLPSATCDIHRPMGVTERGKPKNFCLYILKIQIFSFK